ncbi:MAG: DUF2809 domain-containing protein [Actinomycetota bacterium]
MAGLASRRVDSLPGFVIEHAGDTLWATAAVLALALVWPADARTVALAGFGAAVLVELSQLWKPAWLEDLRQNDVVALAIGRGWVWGDLVRYAVGATLGYGILRLVGGREVVAQ